MTGRSGSEVCRRADARPRQETAITKRNRNEKTGHIAPAKSQTVPAVSLREMQPPPSGGPQRLDVLLREHMAAGGGPILACALGDHLWRRAEQGDLAAIRLLRQTHGRDMPARARIAWRDAEIREMARWLFSLQPYTVRGAAAVLARAGADIAAGRALGDRRPFECLTVDDRAELDQRVRLTLQMCAEWPGESQMRNIING